MELEKKVALIVGAAGGIGSAIARLFAQEGAAVLLADRDTTALGALEAELAASGYQAKALELDLTQSSSVEAGVAAGVAAFGGIDLNVNAAGLLRVGRIDEMSEDDWDLLMSVNVRGVFLTLKHVVPHLKTAGGGVVVNLASVSAFVGADGGSAYHASKGAVHSLSLALAQELAPFGIRVNSLCPGWVDAGFTRQALRESTDPAGVQAAARSAHLLGRMATPKEVAQGALFLASPRASFVTGSGLFIDGGFMVKR
ncbi:MAG: SDR family NAD(P)-dependent oxidoreductase [Meiothermus sp.]|nr:SDR family NAD(P)-dependent oxidoreductase [Meiothermus sp.]